MVRLLAMLMKDPLGYEKSPQYRKLKKEDDAAANTAAWPKDALKGMETNFLMNTILRIGSLMRVGFGSAGVDIISNNLERGRHKDVLFLNKQGSSVSCIFLFCDIRQFTDATECLQEEVFVFTNKIAAVVHSICHSYGGSANKNIGDAFLLSWLLDDAPPEKEEDEDPFSSYSNNNLNSGSGLYALDHQADKALLSVVKISMALYFDKFFTDQINAEAKNRLLTKFSKRKGPGMCCFRTFIHVVLQYNTNLIFIILLYFHCTLSCCNISDNANFIFITVVQMGFGLHAGKAVQGAIGSQRKLDATYVSESVERAEFLESSTKTYGVPLLMTDAFYNLLDPSNRYRCRKLDQLIMLSEEESGLSDPHEVLESGEKMNLYTFDMDIDALWRTPAGDDDIHSANSDNQFEQQRWAISSGNVTGGSSSAKKRSSIRARRASLTSLDIPASISKSSRRLSTIPKEAKSSNDINTTRSVRVTPQINDAMEKALRAAAAEEKAEKPPTTLVLPTGVQAYSDRVWLEPDIKKIRRDYQEGLMFPKYAEGLKSYYAKDWEQAKKCFEFVLTKKDDGPSRYFLRLMAEYDGVPPRNFLPYTIVK